MVEARGLHAKCEEMMTERRREKVSSDARIQTLSSRLEFLEQEFLVRESLVLQEVLVQSTALLECSPAALVPQAQCRGQCQWQVFLPAELFQVESFLLRHLARESFLAA